MTANVLFVDDESQLLSSIRRTLLDEPYGCYLAMNAQEAMEVLEKESIQVIVSDIRMPGRSGIELLADVREAYPNVVRVLMSGQTSSDAEETSLMVRRIHSGEIHRFIAKSAGLDTEILDILRDAVAYAQRHTVPTGSS